MNKKKTKYVGLGFADVIQIVFIVLKLCGLIDWSWWWVLSPIWISIIIIIMLCVSIYRIFEG